MKNCTMQTCIWLLCSMYPHHALKKSVPRQKKKQIYTALCLGQETLLSSRLAALAFQQLRNLFACIYSDGACYGRLINKYSFSLAALRAHTILQPLAGLSPHRPRAKITISLIR